MNRSDDDIAPLSPGHRALLEEADTGDGDDQAERRVWRRLEADLQPRRRPDPRRVWLLAAAGGAVAAAAVLFVVLRPPRFPAPSASAPPAETVTAAVSSAVTPEPSEASTVASLLAGERIELAAHQELSARAGPRATIVLSGPTALKVMTLEPSGRTTLGLVGGRITAIVQPATAQPFAVVMGPYRVEAVGTRFSVEALPRSDEDGAAAETIRVRVEQGAVRVTGPGVDVRLDAPADKTFGESTPRLSRVEKQRRQRLRRRRAVSRPLRVQEPPPPTMPKTTESPPASARSPEDAGLQMYRRARDHLLGGQLEAAQPLLLSYIASHPNGALWLTARLDLVEVRVRQEAFPEVIKDAEELLARGVLDPEMRYELRYWKAEAHRRLAQYPAAIEGFNALSREGGPRSEAAQWSLAWCLAKTGDLDAARAATQNYLSSYPNGEFAPSARALLAPEK